MMRKALLLLFFMGILPIILFAYSVYLWDNDAGLTFTDPDTQNEIGCEVNIQGAFEQLGIDYYKSDRLELNAEELATNFDALYIICGWRSDEMISPEDMDIIVVYLRDYHGKVYVEGNDFVEFMENVYPDILHNMFGIKLGYSGDPEQNVDTLEGGSGTIMDGLSFSYPTRTGPDRGVDEILIDSTANGEWEIMLVQPEKQSKFIYSRGSAYSEYDTKSGRRKVIDNPIAWRTYVQSVVTGAMTPVEDRVAYVDKTTQFLGNIKILLVNDAPKYDPAVVQKPYEELLDLYGYPYDVYTVNDIELAGPTSDIMSHYSAVIWFTGAQYEEPLLDEDFSEISKYLETTKRQLILFSPGLAISEGVPGYYPEQKYENRFLSEVLGTDYIDIAEISKYVTGDPSNYLFRLPTIVISSKDGTREGMIDTLFGGKRLLYSEDTKLWVAVSNVNTLGYKTVYFTDNLEDMYDYAKLTRPQENVLGTTFTDFIKFPILADESLSMPFNPKDNERVSINNEFSDFSIYAVFNNLIINANRKDRLFIYDLTGRLIEKVAVEEGRSTLRHNLMPGVYYGTMGGNTTKFIILP